MKLAADAHAHIESFLREYFVDNTLRLPPVTLHCGYLAAHLTGLLKIGAITLGRRVVIAPALVRREKERLTIPGWLIAHEAVHVLQYERAGYARFLASYLKEYWQALRAQRCWNSLARMNAYLAIKQECEAREAQNAYQDWQHKQRGIKALDTGAGIYK